MKKYLITLIPVLFLGWYPPKNGMGKEHTELQSVAGLDEDLKPTDAQYKAQAVAVRLLSNFHYRKIKLDDSLSSVILDKYIKDIDPGKLYLYQADLEQFEKYRYSFDDFILKGELDVPYEIYNLYRKRWKERSTYIQTLLSDPKLLDFTGDETLDVDRENAAWAASEQELNDVWRKYIKNEALDLKLTGKVDTATVSMLRDRYKNRDRGLARIRTEQAFQTYFNAYAESLDPHTDYMSPVLADRFKQDMSQSVEGIGALLREDGNYIKIVDIIPGGPAFKSKYFQKEDRIIGVAQGDAGKMVDIVGWFVDDAVKLIKGPKGTTVRLQILSADALPNSPPREYRLVREKVKLEEGRAKKEILSVSNGNKVYKVGVIMVPSFYRDFEGVQKKEKEYASTTRDVQNLITELKGEGVDGLVIDLRNNGGGSLVEAVSMTGLFIGKGPVVQVKEATGDTEVQSDTDPMIAYDGPLAVMVNRFSASASEIFAGAIQDYKRGVIIGEPTFGKGTVQTLADLNQWAKGEQLGQVKLTIAKFYRINGSSTQLKGVTPDLLLPNAYKEHEFREEAQTSALPWDQIGSTRYEETGNVNEKMMSWLNDNHENRLQSDEELKQLVSDLESFRSARDNKIVSLQEGKRKKEREEAEKKRAALAQLNDEAGEEEDDSDTTPKKNKKDVYLTETGRVVADMVALIHEPSLADVSRKNKR